MHGGLARKQIQSHEAGPSNVEPHRSCNDAVCALLKEDRCIQCSDVVTFVGCLLICVVLRFVLLKLVQIRGCARLDSQSPHNGQDCLCPSCCGCGIRRPDTIAFRFLRIGMSYSPKDATVRCQVRDVWDVAHRWVRLAG